MKRRDAVYTITLSITGVASLTHCTSSPSEKSKIDHKDKELINSISKAIISFEQNDFKELNNSYILPKIYNWEYITKQY